MRYVPFIAAFALAACLTPPRIGVDSGDRFVEDGVDPRAAATLWVSYQIEVLAIDGEAFGFAATGDGLYRKASIAAGARELRVRLDYRSVAQQITSEPVVLAVELVAGREYRLLDLGEGRGARRVFVPRLVDGAPLRDPGDSP